MPRGTPVNKPRAGPTIFTSNNRIPCRSSRVGKLSVLCSVEERPSNWMKYNSSGTSRAVNPRSGYKRPILFTFVGTSEEMCVRRSSGHWPCSTFQFPFPFRERATPPRPFAFRERKATRRGGGTKMAPSPSYFCATRLFRFRFATAVS